MIRTTATLLVLWVATTAARAADSYPIRLHFPARPGDVVTLSIKAHYEHSEKWTDAGKHTGPADVQFDAVLEGSLTVDAVGDDGRATRVIVTVTRCTKDGNPLLAAGTVVTAENVDGLKFKVDGVPPSVELAGVLDKLIYVARPDEPTADDEYGTDQPQKVGDIWRVNGDQLAKATRLPFKVTGQDFKGRAELTAVTVKDGRTTETVDVADSCEIASRPSTGGATIKNLKMKFEMTMTTSVPDSGDYAATTDRTIAETVVDSKGTRDVRSEGKREIACTAARK